MYSSKRVWGWTLVLCLIAAIGLLLAQPLAVVGAPPFQGPVTPRPTVGLPQPTVATTPVVRQIAVTLIVDKTEAYPGDLLSYKAQVSNVSGQKATNVWLTCDLADQVVIEAFSTDKGVIHQYGQRLSVEMGDFQTGFESYFVKIKARIPNDLLPGTELVSHANLTSDQAGGSESTAITVYKAETAVSGAKAEPTPAPAQEKEESSALPVTGRGSIIASVVIGFMVLIVAVMLWENKERIRILE